MKLKKKYLLAALFILGMCSNFNNVVAFGDEGDGNALDIPGIARPGDLILTAGGKYEDLIPGYWDHVAIYLGYSHHYDSEAGYSHWGYFVIEATPDGVVFNDCSRLNKADEAEILGVYGATNWHRAKVLEYANAYATGAWETSWFRDYWTWGAKTEYDYNYLYGMSTYKSMYCSELAAKAYDWALDGAPGNPWDYRYDNSDSNTNTIDADPGWSGWDYYWACAPSEVHDSARTYLIAYST
ncbi:MAG: hypothetical protein K9W44_06470 [Candidatus Lokiarchaeota archaeon]|nr:hypothetical protein [Candidatus Harpocratesius repetitus]